MRTVAVEKYEYVYLLVRDVIGCASVVRRPEIFENMRNLHDEKYALDIHTDMVREALDQTIEEEQGKVNRADVQRPPQYLLTPHGVLNWQRDIIEFDAVAHGLLINRKHYPQQRQR
jgi:hypothetical protein